MCSTPARLRGLLEDSRRIRIVSLGFEHRWILCEQRSCQGIKSLSECKVKHTYTSKLGRQLLRRSDIYLDIYLYISRSQACFLCYKARADQSKENPQQIEAVGKKVHLLVNVAQSQMSMVQRKVFEQLKGFMVRITFNKKYIFAGLTKEPQAGRNSGKAPIPLGRASGEQGERSLCFPGSPETQGRNAWDFYLWKTLWSGSWAQSQRCTFLLAKSPIYMLGAMFAISQKI